MMRDSKIKFSVKIFPIIHSVFQKRKSIGDWLAGCRNALPAIGRHAISRLKNAVKNQLLMVPLGVRVTGR
jgi:hypothetical protein